MAVEVTARGDALLPQPESRGRSRELLTALHWQPAATARRWNALLPEPWLAVDAEFLLAVLQHHVEGLAFDAIEAAGWSGRISHQIHKILRRQQELAQTRYEAHVQEVAAIARAEPALLREALILKGVFLAPLYQKTSHRMMSDVDIVIAAEALQPLRHILLVRGFWEKPGLNGPTFFKQTSGPQTGAAQLTIDVHLDTPVKFNRPASTAESWQLLQARSRPFACGDVELRTPDLAIHLVNVISHLAEDALSWKSALIENDLRLSRLLDVDVLLAQGSVDCAELHATACNMGVLAELLVGAAVYMAIRGSVAEPLASLARKYDLQGLDRVVALPDGTTTLVEEPALERMFGADRGWRALQLVPAAERQRETWFKLRQGLLKGNVDVAAAAARAAQMAGIV